jgi:hypothetical protein
MIVEGRRPRRLVGIFDLDRTETSVPSVGEAADPPVAPAMLTRFGGTCYRMKLFFT